MRKIILAFLMIIITFSCSKSEKEVEYYEDGKKMFETDYKDGKINGKRIEYFQNGEIKSIVSYNDGIINGEVLTYFEDGIIKSIGNYENGELNGYVKHFYHNGNLKDVMEWQNNKRHGKNEMYYENGELMYSAFFDLGNRIDTSNFYYENGLLKEMKVYQSGEIAYIRFYKKDGEIEFEHIEPKIYFEKDTVKLGGELVLVSDVRFNLVGEVSIDIGNYDEFNNDFFSDTTIVKEKNTTKIHFKFTPKKTGVDSLSVQFNHDDNMDELSVDYIIKRLKYFVEE